MAKLPQRYIPKEFIQTLLARADIVTVIEAALDLKRSGRNWVACCPFHQEKTPSFSVSQEKQFYYCFGCGQHGNVLHFLMAYHSYSFVEAVTYLATELGIPIPAAESADHATTKKSVSSDLERGYAILELAQRYYQQQLRDEFRGRVVQDYLLQRQVATAMITQFNLGYALPEWHSMSQYLMTQGVSLSLAAQIGLLGKNSKGKYFDRFRGRLMFPIRNNRGRVVGFGGRTIANEQPKYLNSPESMIFNKRDLLYGYYEAKQAMRQQQVALVVEGYLDVIALVESGISNVVAALGTAVSEQHGRQLFRTVKDIVFCFDGDNAGRQAAHRAMMTIFPLLQDGRQVKFLFLPEGDDPDSWVKRHGAKDFTQQLQAAVPLADWFFQQLTQGVDLSREEEQARLASQAKPALDRLPQGVFRQLMWQRFASLMGLGVAQLEQAMQQSIQQSVQQQRAPTQTDSFSNTYEGGYTGKSGKKVTQQANYGKQFISADINRLSVTDGGQQVLTEKPASLVEKAIRLLLQNPQVVQEYELFPELEQLAYPHMDLFCELFKEMKAHPECGLAFWLGRWQQTATGDILAKLAAKEFLQLEQVACVAEFGHTLKRLQALYVKQQLALELQQANPSQKKIKKLLQKQAEMNSYA